MEMMNISTTKSCTRRTVEYPIDKRHVNPQDLDDRLFCKELEGPGERFAEDVLPPNNQGVSLPRKTTAGVSNPRSVLF